MYPNSQDSRKCDSSFQIIVGYLMHQHPRKTDQECEEAVYQNAFLLGTKFKDYCQETPLVSIGYFMDSSMEWLRDAIDSQFFTSPSVRDTRLQAREECSSDLEKMRQCELQRNRVQRRRKHKRKASRRSTETVQDSSSDEIGSTREFRRFFQMVYRHRENARSSSESPDRNQQRLAGDYEEAQMAIATWTKRDKLLTLPRLIFIYANKLDNDAYSKVVADLIDIYDYCESRVEVDNNYEISYLNLALFFEEVFLMALNGFRWRNLYTESAIDSLNRIWVIQAGNVVVLKKMQDEITSSPSLHNHIECCINLLEALLFEYMYITACGMYKPETSFIDFFLLPENFTCFNFNVIMDNSVNTFIKLQYLIDSPKQTFYREIMTVLFDSWNDVTPNVLQSFLESFSSNSKKLISIVELIHITSAIAPIDAINLIAFHFEECDWLGYTVDGHLKESEPFVIQSGNRRLLEYLPILKSDRYEGGEQDWYASMKQFSKLYLKLMKSFRIKEQVDAADLWEASEHKLFKFHLEMFNYFLSLQKEDNFCYSKQLDFFFEQFAKLTPFFDLEQCEDVIRAVIYHEVQLQLPHYAKRASEWLCQCYNRLKSLELELADSEKDMELIDILRTACLKIVSSFAMSISTGLYRGTKLANIRYYLKTSFEFFVSELGGRMNGNMFEEEFPVFQNECKITIGTFSKLEGILEKETYEAYAWHLTYKYLGTALLIPIMKREPLTNIDGIVSKYKEELMELVQFIMNTSAKSALIHCFISTFKSITQVKKSKYVCEIKQPLCNALTVTLHEMIVNQDVAAKLLTLPNANELKKEVFQNSIEQLQKCSVFECTIIDYVVETKDDVLWLLDDLLKICKPGEVVQFLIVKYTNAPNDSLAKKRFLDLLLHCAEYYPVPESYERSLKDAQFLEYKGNLFKSVSMSTWMKIPTGNVRNIFSFVLGCTLNVMIAEDRKSFSVTLSETRNIMFSKTIKCCFENNSKWISLVISFKVFNDTLRVFIALNEQIVSFDYCDDTKSKQFLQKASNCPVRWDLSEVFHNTVSVYNAYFEKSHVAALMAMGIMRKNCWTGINFANSCSISLHKFLENIGSSSDLVFDEETLQELKDSEIRMFEKPAYKLFMPPTNFHRQFVSSGGIPALIILYARALSSNCDGIVQNGLLKLILNVMSKPFIDYERWSASTIKSVIVLLLKTDNTVFDWETLKVFLLHCFEFKTTQKLVQPNNLPYQANTFNFQSPEEFCKDLNEALVRDSELIERLICNWDLWIAKPAVLVQLLEFLAANVQSAYPHNIRNMVPVLKSLLKTLSAIANENMEWGVDGKQLGSEIKKFAGAIIRSLEGPTKIEIALDLWNCILLLKPASDMYVENDRINHHLWYDDHCVEFETQNIPEVSMQFDRPTVVHRLRDFNSLDMDSDEEEAPSPVPMEIDPPAAPKSKTKPVFDTPWSVSVRKELYDILIEFVQLSPDDQKLNNDSLCTETLIVLLTKEYHPLIISRIVSLFEKLVNHSSSVEDQFLMIKSFQFRVLGAQLQRKTMGISISNNLFSILLHEEIDIRAGLDSVHVQNFNPDLLSCSVLDAIFVTFTESVLMEDGAEMFTHTCAALTSLYENNFQLAQAMADRSLDVVMVNAFFLICNSTNHDGIANIGIVDHMKKSAWIAFAKKIVTTGIASSDKKVYACAVKLIDLCTLAHCQETSDSRTVRNAYVSNSLHRCLANLLLSGLQTLLVDFDSQEHQSASAVNSPVNSDNSSPEELDFYFVNEGTHRWTDGLYKFKDKLRQKLQGLSPSLNCPYSKSRFHQVPRMEMTARVKKMLSMCQRFYTVCKPSEDYCDEENSFHQVFLDTLLRITLDEVMIAKKPWFFSVQGEARIHLSLLICNTIFDYARKIGKQDSSSSDQNYNSRKKRILHKLLHVHSVPKMKSIFFTNLNIESCVQTTLLEEVLIKPEDDELAKMSKEFLHKYDLPYHIYAENPELITADVRQAISSEYEMIAQWCNENRKEEIRSICYHSLSWKLQFPSEDYTTTVNEITQDAVRTQGDARKIFYTSIMKHFKQEGDAKAEFQKIERMLSHVGKLNLYELSNHPSSISAVQGPRGERIRFDACSPMLPDKFHTTSFYTPEKLSTLCDSKTIMNANRSVKESSLFTCDAIMALNGTYYEGVLVFTDVHIYFLSLENNQSVEITYAEILTIHQRRFELKKLAFELFMENRSTWFFATKNNQDQNIALKFIVERSSCKIAHLSDLQQFSKDWENGKITNFEYIMILNTYSGRTYHDFMQYPIMPHVLASYDDSFVDLCDSSSYRNFKKPIAIQNKMMEERYKNCYAMLEETSLNDAHTAPYHYASLYSNLATVSYYLVRLLPHAKIAIDFQDGAFDCPDRIFHSISSTFRLASGGSATDYKELVPEMFTTPEVYMNMNKFNFGFCQNGEVVDHVILPAWCKLPEQEINEFLKNPKNMKYFQADLFVTAQRHALESRYTQENLHEWIDLIFGYKQTGDPAKNALNLYHPAVYPESIPPDQCEPILYAAHKANVRNIGQVPIQLFNKPHVQRVCDSDNDSFWNCAGIRGLTVGPQLFHHSFELARVDNDEENKSIKLKNLLLGDDERGSSPSSSSSASMNNSSTFFPLTKDFTSITVTFEGDLLTVNDLKTKQTVSKKLVRQILDIWCSPESQLVACLSEFGVIDFYRLNRKNFFGHLTMEILFDGSIQSTYGNFCKFDICQNYSVVFTISDSIADFKFISFWDLNEKRLIRCSKMRGQNLDIFGVLKHTGELVIAETTDYLDKNSTSKLLKYSINGRLMMENTFDFGFIDGDVSQMRPGQGTPMVAVICTDFSIRIIETVTLTCVKYIDLTKIIQSPPKRIAYEDDGNLLITDDKSKKWKLSRKQAL